MKTIKILVIDDEKVIILGVQRILTHDSLFNYDIDFAYNAEEGLNKSLQNKYDIIISDIVMPGMDGMELLHKLIENKVKSQVIMFTGYATMKTALIALKIGAFDFLAKPFTKEELYGSVHRAINTSFKAYPQNKDMLGEKNIIKPLNVYAIPGKTWSQVQKDFNLLIGIEIEFLNSVFEIEKLELIEKGKTIKQGQGFGKVTSKNGTDHLLPIPFSGRVIAANEDIIIKINHKTKKEISDEWLIKLEPIDIEKEVSSLVSKN